ncbi:MAG: hypothetical protein V1866_00650 [archaeon]
MASEQSSIIGVLSKGFNRELTINQLSKSIKKSYAFTNQHAHALMKSNILNRKAVGSAILCLLNLKNEETIAHLVFNSMGEKKRFLDSLPEQKRTAINDLLSKLEDRCIFLEKNKLTIISESKEPLAAKLPGFSISTITKPEFERKAKSIDFEALVILANHEQFWKTIGKAA